MITIAEKEPRKWQFWRTTTVRKTGIVHVFAPSGLTCCGHVAIRECVATGTEKRCAKCVEAIDRLSTVIEAAE